MFNILTISKSNVHALQKLLKVIWPSPTNDVSFIPYTVWEILSELKKKAYRDMHQGFTKNTRVITLLGIQNSLLTIKTSVPNTFGTRHVPSEFRRSLRVLHKCTDVQVDGCTSGDVEFLVPVSVWELGYFRVYARNLLCICILGFSRKHFVALLIS